LAAFFNHHTVKEAEMTGFNMYSRDAQQIAYNFVVNQTTMIETQVVKIQYPDVQYPDLVPVDTMAGNEWVKSITYFSADMMGRAEWFHHTALDVPLAELTRDKFERGIEMAAIGYRWTIEEVATAINTPGLNLTADKASACRRAYEEFVDNTALRGSVPKNMEGLMNSTQIVATTAPADGTSGGTEFADKTNEQVIRDINGALTGIAAGTNWLFYADTVCLPPEVLMGLAGRIIQYTSITLLEWIKTYNVLTVQTGRPLTIAGVRGLEKAGLGGISRMVAYRRDPQVLKMWIPMPHKFLPVWQRGPMVFDVPGIFRLGGVEFRLPAAARYLDGV
jgi:hypothetical protein